MSRNSFNFISTDTPVSEAGNIFFVKFVCLFIVSVFLVLAANTQTVLAQTIKAPLYEDLGKTLGFIMGQRFSLNIVKTEFPNLALQVQVAESEFESSFGNAEENIKYALQEILKEKYPELLEALEKQINDVLSNQQLNQEVATKFIAEVGLRARGEMPSPIPETLLTYQFIDWPLEEFTRGYNRIFRTKNHPKAKNVDFQIRYPISWRPEESERPNIIQKFTSENGHGLEGFNLLVVNIPPSITEQDINNLFVGNELKEMVPEGGKLISTKSIVLDMHKGGMIIYDYVTQQLDMTIVSRALMFITTYDRKLISINCIVGTLPGEEDKLQERFNLFQPLFKIIANSFIIQEQYK